MNRIWNSSALAVGMFKKLILSVILILACAGIVRAFTASSGGGSLSSSSDVISQWTGTCDDTTFMRADGVCSELTGTIEGQVNLSTGTTGSLQTSKIASGTAAIDISGNAATVTDGVVTTGSYEDPAWLTAFAYSKLTGTPTIPNALSDLTDDSTHRVVTDTEKSTWTAKQDAITSISTDSITGLATVATTGSYDDLLSKPTITAPENADWDSASGLSQILNKPTIPSLFSDISGSATDAQIESSSAWNAKLDQATADALYKAIAYAPAWGDVTSKPSYTCATGEYIQEVDLETGIVTCGTDSIGAGAGDNLGSAASSDVVALFGSGTCSGYLKDDGSCDTPGGAGDITSVGTCTTGDCTPDIDADTTGTLPSARVVGLDAALASALTVTDASGTYMPFAIDGALVWSNALNVDELYAPSGVASDATGTGQLYLKTDTDEFSYGTGTTMRVLASKAYVDENISGGTVSDVTATSPLASSGGTTPELSISRASTTVDGYLAAEDYDAFNSKQGALTAGVDYLAPDGDGSQLINIPYSALTGTPVSAITSTCGAGEVVNAYNSNTGLFSCVTDSTGAGTTYTFSAPLSEAGGTVTISAATATIAGYLSASGYKKLTKKTYYLTDYLPDGYVADGSVEYTTEVQNWLNECDTNPGATLIAELGTWVTGSLTYYSDCTIESPTQWGATFKKKANLDTNLFVNSDTTNGNSNITFRNIAIDGNKTNQTYSGAPGLSVANNGIYGLRLTNATFDQLYVHDVDGHGVHINNSAVSGDNDGIHFIGGLYKDNGLGSTDTRGSNIAVTADGAVFDSTVSIGSKKAGWRLSGSKHRLNSCYGSENLNGNIVPVAGDWADSSINGGQFLNANSAGDTSGLSVAGALDGIRLVDLARITLSGVNASGNDGCGVMVLNGCEDITISGGVFNNNGVSTDTGITSSTTGSSGICVKNNVPGTNDNTRIMIDGITAQGNADYDITIENASSAHLGWNIYDTLNNTTTGTVSSIEDDIADASENYGSMRYMWSGTTGTAEVDYATYGATTTTMLTHDLLAADHQVGRGIRITAGGQLVGSGQFNIELRLGSGQTAVTIPAGYDSNDGWWMETEVLFRSATAQWVVTRVFIDGLAGPFVVYNAWTENFSTDKTIQFKAKCYASGQTFKLRHFAVEPKL